jgi:hypothetical protein
MPNPWTRMYPGNLSRAASAVRHRPATSPIETPPSETSARTASGGISVMMAPL